MSGHPRPRVLAVTAALDVGLAVTVLLLAILPGPATAGLRLALAAMALACAVIAAGLWRLAPWARWLQLVLCVPTLCLGFTTFGALVLIGYLTQARTAACFEASGPQPRPGCWHEARRWRDSESPWLVAFLATSAIGCVGWAVALAGLGQSGFMR